MGNVGMVCPGVEPTGNDNLDFVLAATAAAMAALRDEDKRVFVHCVGERSRTPTVAVVYLHRRLGLPPGEALDRVAAVLPYNPHNEAFRRGARRSRRRPRRRLNRGGGPAARQLTYAGR